MNVDSIGVYAGEVWKALNTADVLGLKQIKKITKLKEKEVYTAIGWLARENKITIQSDPEDAKEILVTLVPEN